MYKQVILVRRDLNLPKGKFGAQVAHASVESVLRSDKKVVQKWRSEGMKKVVLQVENEREIYKYSQYCKEVGLIDAIITDAGRTVVEPGTVTCMAIGPDDEEKIDELTKNLKLYP